MAAENSPWYPPEWPKMEKWQREDWIEKEMRRLQGELLRRDTQLDTLHGAIRGVVYGHRVRRDGYPKQGDYGWSLALEEFLELHKQPPRPDGTITLPDGTVICPPSTEQPPTFDMLTQDTGGIVA